MDWSRLNPLRRRDRDEEAARQDDALIDSPAHSDVVEDDEDVLADEGSARPTSRFQRLQRDESVDT